MFPPKPPKAKPDAFKQALSDMQKMLGAHLQQKIRVHAEKRKMPNAQAGVADGVSDEPETAADPENEPDAPGDISANHKVKKLPTRAGQFGSKPFQK
jgi:hypothetical protein